MTSVVQGSRPQDHRIAVGTFLSAHNGLTHGQIPRSLPYQPYTSSLPPENAPPLKRRKLGKEQATHASSTSHVSDDDQVQRVAKSVQSRQSAASHATDLQSPFTATKRVRASVFPARPSPAKPQCDPMSHHELISSKPVSRGAVTTKSYVPEAPTSAPCFHSAGELSYYDCPDTH